MAVKKRTTKRKSTRAKPNGRATTTKRKAKTAKTARGRTTATARKKTAASRTGRKTTTKTTKSTSGKLPSVKQPMTKSGIIKAITDVTTLNKKDVTSVIECLGDIIGKHVKTGGPGKFVLPGLMKLTVVKKPARPARKGVNPFTGEEIMIKAKPASKVVRIKPLKALKEMV